MICRRSLSGYDFSIASARTLLAHPCRGAVLFVCLHTIRAPRAPNKPSTPRASRWSEIKAHFVLALFAFMGEMILNLNYFAVLSAQAKFIFANTSERLRAPNINLERLRTPIGLSYKTQSCWRFLHVGINMIAILKNFELSFERFNRLVSECRLSLN
jgi:hypothetical protein